MPEYDSTVEYRQIEGFPGYFVGSDGSVWHRHLQLRLYPTRHGYLRAALCIRGKPHRKFLVQRLVLEAFVGPCPPGQEARHDPDPSRSNNAISNLKWGTRRQNICDRDRHGRTIKGERQHLAKMTEEKVRAVRAEYAAGQGLSLLGRKYHVRHSTIWHIVTRKTWKHVT